VHEALRPFKDAGYNGTLKLLQIMFEKGLVDREDSGKTHIYFALVSKEKIQQQLLDKMVNRFFDGSPSQLVMHALGNHKPSDAEIAAIEALLQKYKNQ
jgi:predicted transcriptional regulator